MNIKLALAMTREKYQTVASAPEDFVGIFNPVEDGDGNDVCGVIEFPAQSFAEALEVERKIRSAFSSVGLRLGALTSLEAVEP